MEEVVRNSRSDDPLAALHEARRRLFAARTARLVLRRTPMVSEAEVRARGRLARLARRISGIENPIEGEGILDLDQPGAAYDHGQFAVTEIGGDIWGAGSGRSLVSLPVDANCRPGPLWFLGAVEFLDAAVDDGAEDFAGTRCRRLRVSADLTVSPDMRSAPTRAAMAWNPDLPTDLSAVPLTVWIDDAHLRGVGLPIGAHLHTLELRAIGAPLPPFDWSRLGTFRTDVREDLSARQNPA